MCVVKTLLTAFKYFLCVFDRTAQLHMHTHTHTHTHIHTHTVLPVHLNQGPEMNHPYQCTLQNALPEMTSHPPQYQYTQPLVNYPQYQLINEPLEVTPQYFPPYQPLGRNHLYHQFLLETLLVSG